MADWVGVASHRCRRRSLGRRCGCLALPRSREACDYVDRADVESLALVPVSDGEGLTDDSMSGASGCGFTTQAGATVSATDDGVVLVNAPGHSGAAARLAQLIATRL